MKKILLTLGVMLLLFTTGCSSKKESVVVEKEKECVKKHYTKVYIKHVKNPHAQGQGSYQLYYPKVSHTKSTGVNTKAMEEVVFKLVNQLEKNNIIANVKEFHLELTSFHSVDELKENPRFSRLLYENLLHEVQTRKYQLIENKTYTAKNIDFKIVGNYMKLNTGMLVNAKMINTKTNVIISTGQVTIPLRELRKL